MEWVWEPFSENRGSSNQIFTHTMYAHYFPPPGFCWEPNNCGYYDDPIVDDRSLKTYNVEERIKEMYDYVSHMKTHYRSNHLLVTWGGDFFFKNGFKWYSNTDKLIKNFNLRYKDVQLLYSTPGKWLDAIKEADVVWPIKWDDMFPYADVKHGYWTGYFSSWAVAKGFIRDLSRASHLADNIDAIELLWSNNEKDILDLHNARM